MNTAEYLELKAAVIEAGYYDDIRWAESIGPCQSADDFALEHAFVVCNSGMRAQIARPIFEKVKLALFNGEPVSAVYGHAEKAEAIENVWCSRVAWFDHWNTVARLLSVNDQLDWLQSLPWIGPITRYHLAKNLGVDCCKPDRHLVRIAAEGGELPEALCARLAKATGDRVATVDTVIWRAANQGMI